MKMRILLSLLSLMVVCNTMAQTDVIVPQTISDTTSASPLFDPTGAWEYINSLNENEQLWDGDDNPLKQDLVRLLQHSKEPYDSIATRLSSGQFHLIEVVNEEILNRDSVAVRWLNDSTFVVDSTGWNMDLLMTEEVRISYPVDFSTLVLSDSLLDDNRMLDSALFVLDTTVSTIIDTVALESLDLSLYSYTEMGISPTLDDPVNRRSAQINPDSGFLVYTDTISYMRAEKGSLLFRVSGKGQLDSLESAVETLLAHHEIRDSICLTINDMYGKKTPFWVTSGRADTHRFWVKNFKNDSITLWIGNPESNEISILLEDDIDVNRMSVVELDHLPVAIHEPVLKLAEMEELKSDPEFWEYEASSAFSFNQTYLSNWAKGGDNSLAMILDMNGGATYNNTVAKTQWVNLARLKFGTMASGGNGLRKNNDIFEINSKYNKNKWGKVDLSASFYMLNQIAKGYNYPNDSVPVSKFLNPGSITVGLGIDYKPFKETSINLAPLSYKTTFVLDTAHIDQTNHGIDPDKRSNQKLGTQLFIMNKVSPFEDMTITNKIRLFSNYLDKPQNIDVGWEFLLTQKISWFFSIRFNLHLIYDDEVKFTVYDEAGSPVLLPDGSEKKVAMAQFKEFIGLSLLFKL